MDKKLIDVYYAIRYFKEKNFVALERILNKIETPTVGIYQFIIELFNAFTKNYFYEIEESEEYYKKCYYFILAAKKQNIKVDKFLSVLIINNLGVINYYKKNYKEAENLLNEALEIFKKETKKSVFDYFSSFLFDRFTPLEQKIIDILKWNNIIIKTKSFSKTTSESKKDDYSIIVENKISKEKKGIIEKKLDFFYYIIDSKTLINDFLVKIDIDDESLFKIQEKEVTENILKAYSLFNRGNYVECYILIKEANLNINLKHRVEEKIAKKFCQDFYKYYIFGKKKKALEILEEYNSLTNNDYLINIDIKEKIAELQEDLKTEEIKIKAEIDEEISQIEKKLKILNEINEKFYGYFQLLEELDKIPDINNPLVIQLKNKIFGILNQNIENYLKSSKSLSEYVEFVSDNYKYIKIYDKVKENVFNHINNFLSKINLDDVENLKKFKDDLIKLSEFFPDMELLNKSKLNLFFFVFEKLDDISDFLELFPYEYLYDSIISLKKFNIDSIEEVVNINPYIFDKGEFFLDYFNRKLDEILLSNNFYIILKLINYLAKATFYNFIQKIDLEIPLLGDIKEIINTLSYLEEYKYIPQDITEKILESISTQILSLTSLNSKDILKLYNKINPFIEKKYQNFDTKLLIEYFVYYKLKFNLNEINIKNVHFHNILKLNDYLEKFNIDELVKALSEFNLRDISYNELKKFLSNKILNTIKIENIKEDPSSGIIKLSEFANIIDDETLEYLISENILASIFNFNYYEFIEKINNILDSIRENIKTKDSFSRILSILEKLQKQKKKEYIIQKYELYKNYKEVDYETAENLLNEITNILNNEKIVEIDLENEWKEFKNSKIQDNLTNIEKALDKKIDNLKEFLKIYYEFCDIIKGLDDGSFEQINKIKEIFKRKFSYILSYIWKRENIFNEKVKIEYQQEFFNDFSSDFESFFKNRKMFTYFIKVLETKNYAYLELFKNNLIDLKNNIEIFYDNFYTNAIKRYADAIVLTYLKYFEKNYPDKKKEFYNIFPEENFKFYIEFENEIEKIREEIQKLKEKGRGKLRLKDKIELKIKELELKYTDRYCKIVLQKLKGEFKRVYMDIVGRQIERGKYKEAEKYINSYGKE